MLGEVGEISPDSVAGVAVPDGRADDRVVVGGKCGVGVLRCERKEGTGGPSIQTRIAGSPMSMPAM